MGNITLQLQLRQVVRDAAPHAKRTPGPESRRRQQTSKSPASLGLALAATLRSSNTAGSRQTLGQFKHSGAEAEPTHVQLLGSGKFTGGASDLHAPVDESARESAKVFLGPEWERLTAAQQDAAARVVGSGIARLQQANGGGAVPPTATSNGAATRPAVWLTEQQQQQQHQHQQ